ncbi:S41 family peptidase [Mucilaginibacter ginkgonis]|uniref:Uncharacterized protein n=1 Tax=Mucilaginibacter ginkgonis TaxID=2682091 RepID=A0A6I4I2G5_9SPHI|nr:S41 family peptidase [Mucilaginibacter ginkgonis]QQL49160.1 hypothetical protein GO620_013380 [Mucilaginibacter ginkgonis]
MKKLLFMLTGVVLFASCKKDKTVTDASTAPTTGSTLDLIRDSVYLYTKEDYYWNDAIPDYATFNPRGITGSSDLAALQNEVNRLSQYKINPLTSQPYEYVASSPGSAKYSFIDQGGVSTSLSGVSGDFGFGIFYNTTTDLRIKYVNAGSPADAAGIKRGYQITSINNSTNISYDGGTNLNFVVNAYSNSNAITMTLARPDGTTFTANLNTATYTHNPVQLAKVLDQGNGKKVGYLVFNSFVSPTVAQPALDAAFAAFKSAGITDLVVDLRYNGGGYVSTAEYLDNLIAPASASGKVMYAAYYNSTLAAGKEVLLRNQTRKDASSGQTYNYAQIDFSVAGNTVKFGTTHNLSLTNVYFIVTGATASASELTINNLRPYLNVQLIGNTSYGKPVGFFDIDINKYQLYVPEFETKNANGIGGYYTGMKPGSTDYPGYYGADDLTKDFGDPTEKLLANALSYINQGRYLSNSVSTQSIGTNGLNVDQQNVAGHALDGNKFNGMIIKDFRHK